MKPKRPRDVNQLAKMIVDISTGDAPPDPESTKNPAAVALGRLGGAVGGKARAAALVEAEEQAAVARGEMKRGKYKAKAS